MSTNGDNQYGYDYDTNADTTLNILAVNAFRRIGDIAALAGDAATASVQDQRAAALAAAVNARLVGGDGLYVDGLRPDGTPEHPLLPAGQCGGPGLRRGPRRPRIAGGGQHVASLDISVEPDHGMELLRALHAGGRRRRRGADPHRRLVPGVGGHHQGRGARSPGRPGPRAT